MTPGELKELEQFAAEVAEYERTHADDACDDAEDAAWAELQAQYSGELVAYWDRWNGITMTRQVLAHGPNYRDVMEQLASRPGDEQNEITVAYIEPVNAPFCTRLQTGEMKTTAPADGGC